MARRSQLVLAKTLTLVSSLILGCGIPTPSATATLRPSTIPPTLRPVSVPPSSGPTASEAEWEALVVDDEASAGGGELLVVGVVSTALGPIVLGTYDDRAAIWVSAEGRSWVRTQLPGAAQGTRAVAAAVSPNGAVVAARGNTAGAGFGGLWRRVDNRWAQVVGLGAAFPASSVVNSVTWTGEIYVAVGALFPDDPDDIKGATGAIWTSPDGIAWDRQPVPNAARDGNTLLAVGVGPGGVVAGGIGLHSQSTDAVLLTSSDGAAWQSAKAPGLADDQDEEIFRVVATSQRWLVTGRVSPPKCRVTGCITQRGRVWNSADLNSWESVDVGANPPGVFGSDDTAFFAVANEGDGFQVGSSPDGRAWSPVTPILSLPDGVIPGGWLQFDGSFMIVAITVEPDQRIVAWRIT